MRTRVRSQLFVATGLFLGAAAPAYAAPTIVYLNFDGATLSAPPAGEVENASKNEAELVARLNKPSMAVPATVFPADLPREIAIAAIQADVRGHFTGMDIKFVTERPIDDRYTMVVIGGSSNILGIEERELGWGPTDCGNKNPRNVAFVFPETIKEVAGSFDTTQIAATISQEFAHAVGLEHIEGPDDLLMRPVPAIVGSYRFSNECRTIVPGPAVGPEGPGCGATPSCPAGQQNDNALLLTAIGQASATPGAGTTGGAGTVPGSTMPGQTPGDTGGGKDKGCSLTIANPQAELVGFGLLVLWGVGRRRRRAQG